jgi:ankyrin repeat protein
VAVADDGGWTPLHSASYSGHVEVVNLLLASDKVDVGMKNIYGRTPLSHAAERGHEIVAKLLLETGKVEVDCKDNTGRTPLFYAAKDGHEDLLQLLLADQRVQPNFKDHYALTPLSVAAAHGQEESVKLLLAIEGVDLQAKDSFDRTPLWWTSKNGNSRIAKLLLKNAAERGIIITTEHLPVVSPGTYDRDWSRWCDVCTLGIQEGIICYKCGTCNGGDFDICLECFELGAHCLDNSHVLVKLEEISG